MKKRNVLVIVALAIILIGVMIYFIYNKIQQDSRNYQIEQISEYKYFELKENDKYGIIDSSGKILVPVQYDEIKIPNPSKAVFICTNEKEHKVLNDKSEEIFSEYHQVDAIRLKNIASDLMYEKSVLKYFDGTNYGLIDFNGKVIVKAMYQEISSLAYKEGELLVKKQDKYGVINIKGSILVKTQYDATISIDNYYTDKDGYKYAGYIVANTTSEGYRYGYIDVNGNQLLKTEYNELSRISEIKDNENTYLNCAKNGKYGLTKNNKEIIANEYQSIRYDETNNVLVVEKSKKYGVANLDGKIIVPIEYSQIDINGIYMYSKNEQGVTVFDAEGKQININSNIAILKTQNNNYRIKIDNELSTSYSIIDASGKELTKEEYSYIEYLFENYFIAAGKDGKLGVIDNNGNIKIDLIYDTVQKIQNTNFVQVISNANSKIFTKEMQEIYEIKNALIEVKDNIVKIYSNQETKYFDLEGNSIANEKIYTENKLLSKATDGKWGFIDRSGNTIIDCKYERVTELNEYGYAGIKQNGKWGVIDENANIIVEPSYDLNEEIEPSFIGKYHKIVYGFGEFYFMQK